MFLWYRGNRKTRVANREGKMIDKARIKKISRGEPGEKYVDGLVSTGK